MVYYGRGFSDFFVPISSLPKEWGNPLFRNVTANAGRTRCARGGSS